MEGAAYVLSSPLLLDAGGASGVGLGIGSIAGEYFTVFRAPRFTLGTAPEPGSSAWAVITDEWASELGAARGRPVVPGDTLTLSVVRNQTFTIREATLVGIIHYEPASAALKHLVITDGRILRALCGYSQTDAPSATASQAAAATGPGQDADLDSLFSGGYQAKADRAQASSAPISVNELKDLLRQARQSGAKNDRGAPRPRWSLALHPPAYRAGGQQVADRRRAASGAVLGGPRGAGA